MIRFTCTDELIKALSENNIPLEDYKPAYGGESAGMDLYHASNEDITIRNKFKKIPTGLKVIIPLNHVGLICQRGSILKTSFIQGAGVIDPGYTGEIWVPTRCWEYTENPEHVMAYQKLPFQLVVVPCITEYGYISPEEYALLTLNNKRQANQIGSSDKQIVTINTVNM